MLSQEDQDRIRDALASKNVETICPICKTGTFALINGFIAPVIVKNAADASRTFGQQIIVPCVACTCSHCGFLAQFALNKLGLANLFKEEGANA
jgi:hypothetical protein